MKAVHDYGYNHSNPFASRVSEKPVVYYIFMTARDLDACTIGAVP
jgi:hypothetical protein